MQALIPIFAILGAAAGEQLTLLPYAYLANPLPVSGHQSRTEVPAYSNPFTKIELQMKRGPFYNYRDPYNTMYYLVYLPGDGFTATIDDNLPFEIDESLSDGNNANRKEHAKEATANKEEEEERASRRRRSLAADDQDHRQLAENPPSSPQEQIDREPAKASPSPSSHDEPEKKTDADQSGRSATAKFVVAPVYLSDSIPIPRLAGTAISRQYRVDIHNNLRLRAVKLAKRISVPPEPYLTQTMFFPDQLPLAIWHQNRIQGHENVETPAKLAENPDATRSTTPSLPDRCRFNENRPHDSLGQEDPNREDAVKTDGAAPSIETPIGAAPPIETPIAAVPDVTAGETPPAVAVEEALPVITDEEALTVAEEALPVVVTAVSSQSEAHRNARLELTAVPTTFASEPTVYVATSHVQPTIANWPILAPVARSSQYRTQIHSSEKVELTK